jgi:hypothetical protein
VSATPNFKSNRRGSSAHSYEKEIEDKIRGMRQFVMVAPSMPVETSPHGLSKFMSTPLPKQKLSSGLNKFISPPSSLTVDTFPYS